MNYRERKILKECLERFQKDMYVHSVLQVLQMRLRFKETDVKKVKVYRDNFSQVRSLFNILKRKRIPLTEFQTVLEITGQPYLSQYIQSRRELHEGMPMTPGRLNPRI
ncbi:uncharacterized protein [Ptychodera flava]|uniref:uncharacterized protein n=1 Tax=Ptychodera flava TaxID=63121 RepID=UPI003969BDC8